MSTEKLEALKEESEMIEVDVVMRYIRVLSELSNQIKYATQKRVHVEIALIKLMQPAMETDYESLKNRVSNIEKKLENGILIDDAKNRINDVKSINSQSMEKPVKKLELAVPEEVKKVADNWYSITRGITGHLGVGIRKNKLSIDGNSVLCVVYESSIDWQQDNKPENIEIIKEAIADAIGKEVQIELRCMKPEQQYNELYMNLDVGDINFDIEDIDDENEEEEDF